MLNNIFGKRVLHVEDELAIVWIIDDFMIEWGCEVEVAQRLNTALHLAQNASFDFAILDINIAGEPVYPVAQLLLEKNTPFMFLTAYGGAGVREPFRDKIVVQKPCSQKELLSAIELLLI